jgi:hypothetical protein
MSKYGKKIDRVAVVPGSPYEGSVANGDCKRQSLVQNKEEERLIWALYH